MTGIDTNILVQLSLANHSSNAATLSAINAELNAGNILLITPSVVAEFLHVVSDERRFAAALSMGEALDWIEEFLGNTVSVRVVSPSEASIQLAVTWMRQFNLGRKRILDTDLAATLYTVGCRRLMTSNASDFEVFKVFEVISP